MSALSYLLRVNDDERIITEAIQGPVVVQRLMRNHDVMLGDCYIAHPSSKVFQFLMLVHGLFPSAPIMSWVCDDETITALSLTIVRHQKHLYINCLNANLETLLDVQRTNQCICFSNLICCSIGTLLPTLFEKRHSMSGLHQSGLHQTNAHAFEYALKSLIEMVTVFPSHFLISQESTTWKELTRKT